MFIYTNRLLLFTFILLSNNLLSQAKFTTRNAVGNWNGGTSDWTIVGVDADNIPDQDDTVEIQTGHTVNTLSNQSTRICKLINNGEINLNSTYPLYVYGNGTTSENNGIISGTGTYWQVRSGTLQGSGTMPNAKLSISFQNLIIDQDLTINNTISLTSGGDLILNNSRTLTINDILKASSGTTVTNNGVFVVNSSGFFSVNQPSNIVFFSSLGDIIWNSTADFQVAADSYKNVTINSSVSCNSSFSLSGDWSNTGTFSSSVSGNSITFTGNTDQSIAGGTINAKRITFNNSDANSDLDVISGTVINVEEFVESLSGRIDNAGTINLKSDVDNSAGMLKVNNFDDFNGVLNIERLFTVTSQDPSIPGGWVNVASPINSTSITDWDSQFIFCGDFSAANFSHLGCGGFTSVYFYNEAAASSGGSSSDGWLPASASFNGQLFPDSATLIWANPGSSKISKSGIPNLGNSSNIVSVTTKSSGSGSNNGWNLVSNPFPCSINYASLRASNSFLPASYYSINNGSFSAGTGTIPHSQGFIFKSTSGTDQTLNFNLSHLTTTDPVFYKSVNGINTHLNIILSNNSNNFTDKARIFADSQFSNDYDIGEDCFKLFSMYPNYSPSIYVLDNQQNKLERSCINNNLSETVYFDVIYADQAYDQYTLSFENMSQFMIGSCINLEDLHNGILTDLRADTAYTFTIDSLAPSPRFKINIDVNYDIRVINSNCFNDSSASVMITGDNISGHLFQLLDSTGNVIHNANASTDTIVISNLNAGTYNIVTNHQSQCNLTNHDLIITQPKQIISNFITASDTFFLDTSLSVNVYFKNLSVGASFYDWNFGNGITSNDKNPLITFSFPGDYDVTLTSKSDSLGTCSKSFQKTISIIDNNLTTNILNKENSFKIFNRNGKLVIVSPNATVEKIQLIDISGKLVTNSFGKNHLDISDVSPGIYLLSFKSFEKILTQKIHISKMN